MFEAARNEEEAQGQPEDGDVFCSATGEHLGSMDTEFLHQAKSALHIQLLHNDQWYCYQLVSVEDHTKEK